MTHLLLYVGLPVSPGCWEHVHQSLVGFPGIIDSPKIRSLMITSRMKECKIYLHCAFLMSICQDSISWGSSASFISAASTLSGWTRDILRLVLVFNTDKRVSEKRGFSWAGCRAARTQQTHLDCSQEPCIAVYWSQSQENLNLAGSPTKKRSLWV